MSGEQFPGEESHSAERAPLTENTSESIKEAVDSLVLRDLKAIDRPSDVPVRRVSVITRFFELADGRRLALSVDVTKEKKGKDSKLVVEDRLLIFQTRKDTGEILQVTIHAFDELPWSSAAAIIQHEDEVDNLTSQALVERFVNKQRSSETTAKIARQTLADMTAREIAGSEITERDGQDILRLLSDAKKVGAMFNEDTFNAAPELSDDALRTLVLPSDAKVRARLKEKQAEYKKRGRGFEHDFQELLATGRLFRDLLAVSPTQKGGTKKDQEKIERIREQLLTLSEFIFQNNCKIEIINLLFADGSVSYEDFVEDVVITNASDMGLKEEAPTQRVVEGTIEKMGLVLKSFVVINAYLTGREDRIMSPSPSKKKKKQQ